MKPNLGRALLAVLVASPIAVGARVASAQERGEPLAREIIREAKKAVGKSEGVRFQVRNTDGYPIRLNDARRIDGQTSFTVLRSRPARYRARFVGPAGDVYHVLVASGGGVRFSAYGKESNSSDREAYSAVSGTVTDYIIVGRMFVDGRYFDDILDRGAVVLAGADILEGEVCDVVVATRSEPERFSTSVTTLWFSRETHLPRGIETRVYNRGSRNRLERRIISKIELLDNLDEKILDETPKAEQTVPLAPTVPTPPLREEPVELSTSLRAVAPPTAADLKPLLGRDVKELILGAPGRTESIKLAEILSGGTGKPDQEVTLVTFWASWRAHARAELDMLHRLEGLFPDKLRVVVVGIADDPREYQRFLKQKPDFRFTYYHDPEWAKPGETRLKKEFMLTTLPSGVLIDSNGGIVDAWRGRISLSEANARVSKQLKPVKKP